MRKSRTILVWVPVVLGACGSGATDKVSPAAGATAVHTREAWHSSAKPLEIDLAGFDKAQLAQVHSIGLSVLGEDMTEAERQVLSDAEYTLCGSTYQNDDRHARLSERPSTVAACHPHHPGISYGDTMKMHAPFGENLYGQESTRTVGDTIRITIPLQTSMAMLRLAIESDDLRHRLEQLRISGDLIWDSANYRPYQGLWTDKRNSGNGIDSQTADCILNNGRTHDYYLIPTDSACLLSVTLQVSGQRHTMTTTLPPMLAGSMTRVGLKLSGGTLSAGSSWVETRRPLSLPTPIIKDTVRIGHYLQNDGSISRTCNSNSIAVVIATDGTHGRAAGLNDIGDRHRYGDTGNVHHSTLDGIHTEGTIVHGDTTKTGSGPHIPYRPSGGHPSGSALAHTDGVSATQHRLRGMNPPQDIWAIVAKTPGSYIPSLGELARFHHMIQPGSGFTVPDHLSKPCDDYYHSCSEAVSGRTYVLNPVTGEATTMSATHGKARLRLFHIF